MFDNLSYQLTPYDNFKDNLIVYPRCSKTLIFIYLYTYINQFNLSLTSPTITLSYFMFNLF